MSSFSAQPMTRPELRLVLDFYCGCGSPEAASAELLALLRLHPLYEHQAELDAKLPDDGLRMLVLYVLCHLDLTEHGGTVEGGWLTDKGKAVQAALEREEADGFKALHGDHCVHGYDLDDQDHDCMADEPA